MRDFFPIALSEVNAKGEECGTLFVFLHQIVCVRKLEKSSKVVTVAGEYSVKESFEDISKKCAIYGLIKVV